MKKKNKGKILAITGVILMVLPFLSLYIPNIDDIKDFNYFFLLSVYGGITLIFLSLIRKIYTESEKDEFRLSTIFKMSNYSKTDLIIISSLMGVIASKYFDFIWTKMSSFVISSMFELFLFPAIFVLAFIIMMFITICLLLAIFFILERIKNFVLS